ncbi:hypothetical protein ACHWQZ_G003624 [Mnemiopsis leidyi]
MNMTETVGGAIWAELIKEILKPTSLIHQALFPLTTASISEVLRGGSRTIQLPPVQLNLPLPHLSLLNPSSTTDSCKTKYCLQLHKTDGLQRHHTSQNVPLPSSKSFLIEDLLKESVRRVSGIKPELNSIRGSGVERSTCGGVERSTCGVMSMTCSSGGLGHGPRGEGCHHVSSRIARRSDPLADSIEAEFHRRSLRKERTVFTKSQLSKLKARFCYQKYLSSEERAQLACSLSLTEEQVQRWFQNRRAKVKRQESTTTSRVIYNPFSFNTPSLGRLSTKPEPIIKNFF